MPKWSRRGCSFPGCPRLAEKGTQYCAEHEKQENARYDKYVRSPDHGKKYGNAWQHVRKRYVAAHPLCEECLKEGRFTPVEEVHHILPVSRGGPNEETNLMSLCRSCHVKIHIRLGDR